MKATLQRELSNLGREERRKLAELPPELRQALFAKWRAHVAACQKLNDCIPMSLADFLREAIQMSDKAKAEIWTEDEKRSEYEPPWHYDQYVGSKEK